MLTHPTDPSLYLLTIEDIDSHLLPPSCQASFTALKAVADWSRDYLSNPHPELGRTGPVCPYVPTAIKKRQLFFTAQPGGLETIDRDKVAQTIAKYRDWFQRIEPTSGPAAQFKAILVVFPDIPTEEAPLLIDKTQAVLKPGFVDAGLMIGQFHPLPPNEAGLRNPEFRPLRSPVPLLAMRHMVPSDLPFLTGDRIFLEGYQRTFSEELLPGQRQELVLALAKLHA